MSAIDDPLGAWHQRALLAALVSAALVVSLILTLGAPLIPTIARENGVSLEAAQWTLTLPLLVGAVSAPVLGRLADGARRKPVLMSMLTTVAAGSVLSATAGPFAQLLIGRGLQGLGYATVPIGIALAREHLRGERLRGGIATLSITVVVGTGLGFTVTGLLAEGFGLSAAFWFGGAFAVAALAAVWFAVPRTPTATGRIVINVPEALVLGGGLASLLLGISRAEVTGWGSPGVLALFAAAAALLIAWVAFELRVEQPLVDLRLLSQPVILAANMAGLLLAAAMYIGLTLINLLAQAPATTGYGFGASVLTTSLLLTPLALGSLAGQPAARLLVARYGPRAILPAGALVVAAAQLGLALSHGALWQLALCMAFLGVGVASTFAAMPALIVASVPRARTGSAISANQVLRSVGASLGSATSATVLAAYTTAGSPFAAETGYAVAFGLSCGICALAALALRMLIPAGRRLEGAASLEQAG